MPRRPRDPSTPPRTRAFVDLDAADIDAITALRRAAPGEPPPRARVLVLALRRGLPLVSPEDFAPVPPPAPEAA